jgi:hypothetical protein
MSKIRDSVLGNCVAFFFHESCDYNTVVYGELLWLL